MAEAKALTESHTSVSEGNPRPGIRQLQTLRSRKDESPTSTPQSLAVIETNTTPQSCANDTKPETRVVRLESSDPESGMDVQHDESDDDWDHRSASSASTNFAELERFRQLQKMLDHFSQGSIDPVIMIDDKGTIKSMNTALLQLFGYRRWELVGKNIKALMPAKIAAKHDGYLLRYKKSKCRRIIGEVRDGIQGVKKDGTIFPLILKVQEVEDENGGSAFVGIMRDMSVAEELHNVSALLSNILPLSIAERLKNGEKNIADDEYGTVIFIDLVGFTKWSSERPAREVIGTVNRIFRRYDAICDTYGLEKIKTIGDCMMAVCGVPTRYMDHPVRTIEMAMAVMNYMATEEQFSVRIGVCTGPLIAGVLDGKKMAYDIWGDTVNTASRLETLAPHGGVCVSQSTRDETAHKFIYSDSKIEDIKGKGPLPVYILQGRKSNNA